MYRGKKLVKNLVQLGKGGIDPLPPASLGGLHPPNPPVGLPYPQIAPEARHPYGALDRLI